MNDGYELRSVVPWILVGAGPGGRPDAGDSVLARGGEAGVELVGFVRELERSGRDAPALRPPGARFAAARSERVPALSSAADQRPSYYTFAWRGRPSLEIDQQFDRALPDILRAIEDGSAGELEWAIARVVYHLHANEARAAARRLWLCAMVAAIVVAALVALAILL